MLVRSMRETYSAYTRVTTEKKRKIDKLTSCSSLLDQSDPPEGHIGALDIDLDAFPLPRFENSHR